LFHSEYDKSYDHQTRIKEVNKSNESKSPFFESHILVAGEDCDVVVASACISKDTAEKASFAQFKDDIINALHKLQC
jgi:NACalpha-BTF3-like transcription factor